MGHWDEWGLHSPLLLVKLPGFEFDSKGIGRGHFWEIPTWWQFSRSFLLGSQHSPENRLLILYLKGMVCFLVCILVVFYSTDISVCQLWKLPLQAGVEKL